MLERVERTSVIAEVMAKIRGLVESGHLAPGVRLPSERELRESLGVGRSTVREAIRALEALGLLEVRQGRGIYVRNRSESLTQPRGPLEADWAQLDRVVEARLPIETYAASLAALRRTDERLAKLEEKLDDFERAMAANDLGKLVLADLEFHNVIADTASSVLATCLNSIGVLVINSRRISLARPERLPDVLARHRLIFEAIVAQDPHKAAQAMSEHLLDFISQLGFEVAAVPQDRDTDAREEMHYIIGTANPNLSAASGRSRKSYPKAVRER
jgi:GntR family transcriptional repressor for pyruvate dehydrogenase complex